MEGEGGAEAPHRRAGELFFFVLFVVVIVVLVFGFCLNVSFCILHQYDRRDVRYTDVCYTAQINARLAGGGEQGTNGPV